MNLLESGEMYLEMILILGKDKTPVRSVDIANYAGYSKPSVSRAVGLLKNGGYILVDESGYITLTETGSATAHRIYERHQTLTDFFVSLGVDQVVAAADACKIEHVISAETFEAIKKHASLE